MTARPTVLALALALAACVDRPAPEDTDITGSASTSATGNPTSDSTTGVADPTEGGPVPGVHAGPCQPIDGDAGCPMGNVCCSDDPATVGGKIPNYYMDGVNNDIYGAPIFSDNNNALSYWGYCIDTGEFSSPLINGCPVPCNPTWAVERISEICGTAQCCPFTAIDPDKDCILDAGTWRAVNGTDIGAKKTNWGATHSTNQDPTVDSCKVFSGGNQTVLSDCLNQLTVADQRGFCFAPDCPCTEDLCAAKNPGYVLRCN